MVMKFSVNKEIKLLSLGFLLIFLGFNGVQQYITTFFSDIGLINLGFQSLILIYLFFTLFGPFSSIFVSKYGAKKCIIFSSIFYFLFIISLLSKSVILIYISSSLLGIAASLLWTGQNSYLIRASDKHTYGKNSGFFNSFFSLGSALGIFILGFLISKILFNKSFLIYSIFPIIGIIFLFKLKNLKAEPKTNYFKLIKKSLTSKNALRLASIWFVVNFVYGLIIGIIPLEIKKSLGIPYIGILSSLFYIVPIFLSYSFGKFSDIKGRKKIILFSYGLLIIGLLSLCFSQYTFLFLIFGIILLALNWAIIKPITLALVGDVTTENNLEVLTALFWMFQNIGIVSALILSYFLKVKVINIYIISIIIITASLIILLPLFKLSTEKIKEKISQEVD